MIQLVERIYDPLHATVVERLTLPQQVAKQKRENKHL